MKQIRVDSYLNSLHENDLPVYVYVELLCITICLLFVNMSSEGLYVELIVLMELTGIIGFSKIEDCVESAGKSRQRVGGVSPSHGNGQRPAMAPSHAPTCRKGAAKR